MTPVEQVRELYGKSGQGEDWPHDLEAHLLKGYVFGGPGFFCMGRPVVKGAAVELIRDPCHSFPVGECDAWYVAAMAGDMAEAWRHFPYELPWICFDRFGDLRCRMRWCSVTTLRKKIALRPSSMKGAGEGANPLKLIPDETKGTAEQSRTGA